MVLVTSKNVYDAPLRIRYRGAYEYNGLLALIRTYYKDHLFTLKEPKLKYKVGGSGAEVEFKFLADRKITHYVEVIFDVKGHFWDVVRDDKGITRGKLEITINAKFVLNYAGTFSSEHKMEKWMQKVLDSEETGLQFSDNKSAGKSYLKKLTRDLQKKIKKHLKMECV